MANENKIDPESFTREEWEALANILQALAETTREDPVGVLIYWGFGKRSLEMIKVMEEVNGKTDQA